MDLLEENMDHKDMEEEEDVYISVKGVNLRFNNNSKNKKIRYVGKKKLYLESDEI